MQSNSFNHLTVSAINPCVCYAAEKAKDRSGGHRFGLLERDTTTMKIKISQHYYPYNQIFSQLHLCIGGAQ